jgi:hypothetical protein
MKKSMTVTFPNGDESIVITAGKQANMLKLTSNNQTIRFDGLELSNHEVVHAKELPGVSSGLDSLTSGRIQYSYYREDEESDQDTLDPGSEA